MDTFADVLGQEVAGQVVLQTFNNVFDGRQGFTKGFVMADVGDNHIVCFA